jgi:hypothetical protein
MRCARPKTRRDVILKQSEGSRSYIQLKPLSFFAALRMTGPLVRVFKRNQSVNAMSSIPALRRATAICCVFFAKPTRPNRSTRMRPASEASRCVRSRIARGVHLFS